MSAALQARALHERHPFPWRARSVPWDHRGRGMVFDARDGIVCETSDSLAAEMIASVMNAASSPPVSPILEVPLP